MLLGSSLLLAFLVDTVGNTYLARDRINIYVYVMLYIKLYVKALYEYITIYI